MSDKAAPWHPSTACTSDLHRGCPVAALPWLHRGCTVAAPWLHRGCTVGAPWPSRGCTTLAAPWLHHGCTVVALWLHRGCTAASFNRTMEATLGTLNFDGRQCPSCYDTHITGVSAREASAVLAACVSLLDIFCPLRRLGHLCHMVKSASLM